MHVPVMEGGSKRVRGVSEYFRLVNKGQPDLTPGGMPRYGDGSRSPGTYSRGLRNTKTRKAIHKSPLVAYLSISIFIKLVASVLYFGHNETKY